MIHFLVCSDSSDGALASVINTDYVALEIITKTPFSANTARIATAELKLEPGSITQAISDSLSAGTKDIITVGMRLDKEGMTLSTGSIGVVNYAIGVKPDGFGITSKDTGYFGIGYEIDIGGGSKGNLPAIMMDPNGVYRGAGSRIRCPIYLAAPLQIENQLAFGDSAYMTTWYENNDQRKENILLAFNPAVEGTGIRLRSTTGSEIFYLRAGPDPYVINTRYPTKFNGNVVVNADFAVQGAKNNVVDTEHYGKRLLNAYETLEYYYGDLGFGTINTEGECHMSLDDIFLECVNTKQAYHVFTQVYTGKITSTERNEFYVVLKGEPGTEFSWQALGKRRDYELNRADTFTTQENMFPEEFETELTSNPGENTTKILGDEIQFNLDDYLLG